MKNINVIKTGKVVNLSINGKLNKKVCGSDEEAEQLYKLATTAKENPSDENIKALRMFLNEKTRVAYLCGLETDLETGEAFLAGFNTPIPMTLLEVIKEYHEKGYPLDAILNFWKLLMINPDTRVRQSLFNFITTHDFVLTDKGYMVVYKAVYRKNEEEEDDNQASKESKEYVEFITNKYLFVKNKWRCSANKYVVYKNLADSTYDITKFETAENWNEKEKGVEIKGKLGDLYAAIIKADNDSAEEEKIVTPKYTDMHSRTMTIELGVPVLMPRKECDSDPANDCSYGLHVGATGYVNRFANRNSVILVCLVNPMHVVAVPEYDHSKMRVAEYFPYTLATYENNKIEIVESVYFEDDYCNYEITELENAITKVKSNELPFNTAIKAKNESRPMSELMKMLESRIIDIS
jgi:hypothetical protein